ncbi:hypothetical protein MNB_SUP05-SYMBIONT-5-635 [hydrothermal vent metagenome]|uniref:Methyltransferase domain-containing protein n=1 Tax=hydrothermal vent metagenome TaxID=652676 RepID=A0A1W1E256_9ZZZZ
MLHNNRKLDIVKKPIKLARTNKEINKVRGLRMQTYQNNHSDVRKFHNDGMDKKAYVLYACDKDNNITSTARLLPDSKDGFPAESMFSDIVQKMRSEGKNIAELGRLVINEKKGRFFRLYYKTIYDIALHNGIDIVLMIMKVKNIHSHKNIMAIEVLSQDMGVSWDQEQAKLVLVAWDIKARQPDLFYKWTKTQIPSIYSKEEWKNYSPFHLGVLTSIQHEVYKSVSSQMQGRVLDAGCGSARIMAFIKGNINVDSYTGVDFTKGMINQASWLKEQLKFDKAQLLHNKIEDVQGEYDSILSIHSYYSWPNPDLVLSHIYELLKPAGIFILVTPNHKFNAEKLTSSIDLELLGHPYYKEFMQANYDIASKAESSKLYLPMDCLIHKVRKLKFQVVSCHNEFFLGGASCLVLTKDS